MRLFSLLRNTTYQFVFVVAGGVAYFLVPNTLFSREHILLVALFILLFATTAVCVVHAMRERIAAAATAQQSLFGIIASVLGFSALHVCGAAAPACGTIASVGLAAAFFPGVLLFIRLHGTLLLWLSIALQLVSLYFLGCFRRERTVQ